MYGCNNMPPPPWMWPPGPAMPAATPQNPVDILTGWQRSLDELKKAFKEEKKDDGKKKAGADGSVISMMLFMLLISPITGPSMYYFFQLSIGLLHK